MEKNTQIQINHLQENLMAIRKIAGWTVEEFGEKIGVTKQTIPLLKYDTVINKYMSFKMQIDEEENIKWEEYLIKKTVKINILKILEWNVNPIVEYL
jgi:DNA-binding XRE family transcriptional regulator